MRYRALSLFVVTDSPPRELYSVAFMLEVENRDAMLIKTRRYAIHFVLSFIQQCTCANKHLSVLTKLYRPEN